MAWRDVCVRGKLIGGRVREDQPPRGSDPKMHDAGAMSPGIEKFIREVVRSTPSANTPPKPSDFPAWVFVDGYPGRGNADVHFEGRAADIHLWSTKPNEKVWGDWLFDWCVANCTIHKVQGVKFGTRRWFSEEAGGKETVNTDGQHFNHVHVELNCDGASLGVPPPPPPPDLVGTWDVTIGTWSGIFVFAANRDVFWANSPGSKHTPGAWAVDGGTLYFDFHDPGDFRIFTVTLPLNTSATSGKILPEGQGFFEMSKR